MVWRIRGLDRVHDHVGRAHRMAQLFVGPAARLCGVFQPVWTRICPARCDQVKRHGNQKKWFTTVQQRTGRLVYRHGAHRSVVPGKRSGTRSGASVTFEPGARTAWHTHPLGQTLIVTAGCGWAQREGGPIEEIRPGDVVWFPPGEKHWHGATPTTAMTHIAIQEQLDGKVVDWMEKVSDEQYQG